MKEQYEEAYNPQKRLISFENALTNEAIKVEFVLLVFFWLLPDIF